MFFTPDLPLISLGEKLVHPSKVGKRYERAVLYSLARNEALCLYVPGSGRGKSLYHLPDVVCIKEGRCVLIEMKRRSDDRNIYITKNVYCDLVKLREISGCRVLVCASFPGIDGIKCIDIDQYDWETDRYVVFERTSFFTRGIASEKVFK